MAAKKLLQEAAAEKAAADKASQTAEEASQKAAVDKAAAEEAAEKAVAERAAAEEALQAARRASQKIALDTAAAEKASQIAVVEKAAAEEQASQTPSACSAAVEDSEVPVIPSRQPLAATSSAASPAPVSYYHLLQQAVQGVQHALGGSWLMHEKEHIQAEAGSAARESTIGRKPSTLQEMQSRKARVVPLDRHRSPTGDISPTLQMQIYDALDGEYVQSKGTCRALRGHYEWPTEMFNEGLRSVKGLATDVIEEANNNTNYGLKTSKLFQKMPAEAETYGEDSFGDTPGDKALLLVQLVNRHKGEVIELNPENCRWTLQSGPTPIVADSNQQFTSGIPPAFGSENPDWRGEWSLGQAELDRNTADFRTQPAWHRQEHRCFVPCNGETNQHWARVCSCSTLGHLFVGLKWCFSAHDIYAFYHSRRLVSVKYTRSRTNMCNVFVVFFLFSLMFLK